MSPTANAPHSLSPSRANDFKNCPLQYRFRTIDKLPEPTTPAMVKGTLVHAVLERLYDLPAAERTPQRAIALLPSQWQQLQESDPKVAQLFVEEASAETQWLDDAKTLVESYFRLEDPRRLQPSERETLVEAITGDGVALKGFIDRLDVAPTGEIRVVDYKTGASPRAAFEAKALWQLKFYGLVLWRTRQVIPRVLRLLYLKDSQVIDYSPTEQDLVAMEKSVNALWIAIGQAITRGDFRPKKTALCGWCAFQEFCPEFGGTPPPYPLPVTT